MTEFIPLYNVKVTLTMLTILCVWCASEVNGFGGTYSYHTTKKSKCLNPPRTARRVENFIGECQEEVKNQLVSEAYQILKDEVAKENPSENDDYAFDLIETTQQEKPTENNWVNDQEYPQPPSTIDDEDRPASYDDKWVRTTSATVPDSRRKGRSAATGARLLHRIRRISDVGNGAGIYHPTLVPYEDKRIAGCLLHCVYAKNNAIDQLGWPTLDGLVDFYSEGVNEHGFFMATLRSVNLCLRAVTNKYHVDRRKLPKQGESCDLAFDVFDCISDQLTGYCLDQYD